MLATAEKGQAAENIGQLYVLVAHVWNMLLTAVQYTLLICLLCTCSALLLLLHDHYMLLCVWYIHIYTVCASLGSIAGERNVHNYHVMIGLDC